MLLSLHFRLPPGSRYVAIAQDWESDSFITPKHLSDQTNAMTHTAVHTHRSNPPAPKRTSSKVIVLNQRSESNMTPKASSTPSAYRSRDAVNRFWRNRDIAEVSKNHSRIRNVPDSVSLPSWSQRETDVSRNCYSATRCHNSMDANAHPMMCTNSAYIDPPPSQPIPNNRHRSSYPSAYPTVEVSYTPSPQPDPDSLTDSGGYGATFMVRFGDQSQKSDSNSVFSSVSARHRHPQNNVPHTQYRNNNAHESNDTCDNNQVSVRDI